MQLTLLSFGQDIDDTIKVIAKLIRPGVGSKIYIEDYKVIKVVKGTLTNDTISAGYYWQNEFKIAPKLALLTLMPYKGDSKTKDYYIFPEYDQKNWIKKIS